MTARWLLLATHVPPSGAGGGMIRYATELGRALSRRDDIELHVLVRPETVSSAPAVFAVDPEHVSSLAGGVALASLRQRAGRGMGELDAFDVVFGTKHLLPRRAAGVRLLTVHDLLPFDRPADFGRLKRMMLPREYRASLRGADALVCVSEATRHRLIELEPDLAGRAVVTPLALSSALRLAAPQPVPALVGRPFALVVGDASPRKNLRFLAQLWPAVRRRHPDLVLAVAGPAGWGVDDGLDDLDARTADASAVRLGHIDDAQLQWAYAHAAVVLCPSLLEGFGLPALEAVTFGAPLVSSPDPALAEAAHGQARVVRLDDPLGWVEQIDAAVSAGRSRPLDAARTWDDVAAETVAAADAARRGRGRP